MGQPKLSKPSIVGDGGIANRTLFQSQVTWKGGNGLYKMVGEYMEDGSDDVG